MEGGTGPPMEVAGGPSGGSSRGTADAWLAFHARWRGDRALLDYAVEHWEYHRPLYTEIRRRVSPPARILEVGCGYAFSAIYLQALGYQVVAIDNVPEVVQEARECGRLFGSAATIEEGDAADLGRYRDRFDLVYSLGVMEHFSREVAVGLIRDQARCAPQVAVVVPTRFSLAQFPPCDVGWIVYSRRALERLLRDAGFAEVRTLGYGDVALPLHRAIKGLLPYGLYRLLQRRFGYALGLACFGRMR